jgi:hypothetical protein
MPTRITTDYSIFTVNYNFEASPSIRRSSAANAVCNDTDIFNEGYISLTDFCNYL